MLPPVDLWSKSRQTVCQRVGVKNSIHPLGTGNCQYGGYCPIHSSASSHSEYNITMRWALIR